MARKVITVCDICESAQGIRQWEVKDIASGSKKKVDACVTHSTPFARLFEDGKPQENGEGSEVMPPRQRGRSRTPVVSE